MHSGFDQLIRPRKGWEPIDFREIWSYRELLGFLVLREVQIRYRQTLLGGLWAIFQPLFAMLIFTVLFNRLAGISADGPPYPLFAYSGLVVWTFFANALSASSASLVNNRQLVSKVYFPRLFLPLGSIGGLVVDMFVALILVGALMLYYAWPPSPRLVLLPVFVVGAFLAAAGSGFTLSALNVSFRDVKYVTPFFVQMGLFITPVIYPVRYVPERYQALLGVNPMAGMVEGFRHSLLGTPIRWDMIAISFSTSVALFLAGLLIFRRMERRFADAI